MNDSMENWLNDIDGGKLTFSENNLSRCHFVQKGMDVIRKKCDGVDRMAPNKNEWQALVKMEHGKFFKKNHHPAACKGAILCVVNL